MVFSFFNSTVQKSEAYMFTLTSSVNCVSCVCDSQYCCAVHCGSHDFVPPRSLYCKYVPLCGSVVCFLTPSAFLPFISFLSSCLSSDFTALVAKCFFDACRFTPFLLVCPTLGSLLPSASFATGSTPSVSL